MRRVIRNARVVGQHGILPACDLAIDGGRIASLGEPDFPAEEVIDASGLIAVPGFIDLHIQGGDGASVMDADPHSLDVISKAHARFGTTGFLPTPTPDTSDDCANLRAIAQAMKQGVSGAKMLGVHLEGPFVNPQKLGGFGEEYVRPPSVEAFDGFQSAAGGHIKMVTLSPELEGAAEVIRHLAKRNIVASAGHTAATFEQMMRAIDMGVSHVTHMYNTMSPFAHRAPGAVGAVLLRPEVSLQIIADGHHLHPATVRLTVQLAGVDRIALITDAMHMLGLPEGRYSSFGHQVESRNGKVQLRDGSLAGSLLTMNCAVKHATQFAGIPLFEAVRMATTVPARVLGLRHRKGSLEPGKDADIVLMDDQFDVHLTVVEGRPVFRDPRL